MTAKPRSVRHVSRRAFLAAGTGLLAAAGCEQKRSSGSAARAPRPQPPAPLSSAQLRAQLRTELLRADPEKAFDVAARALRSGAERMDVWWAVGDALESFRGDVLGRSALVSLAQLNRRLQVHEQLVVMLRAVDLLKREQAFGAPVVKLPALTRKHELMDSKQLISRLHDSFAANDASEVAQCLRSLHTNEGTILVTEQLAVMAARADLSGGDGTTYVAQALWWLDRHRWWRPDQTLDAMAVYLLKSRDEKRSNPEAAARAYKRARTLSVELEPLLKRSVRSATKPHDPAPLMRLLSTARESDGGKLSVELGRCISRGMSLEDAFAALALAAAERALHDKPGEFEGVRAIGLLCALHRLAMTTPTRRTALLLLLMAGERLGGQQPTQRGKGLIRIDRPPALTKAVDSATMMRGILQAALKDWRALTHPIAVYELSAHAPEWARALLTSAVVVCAPKAGGPRWERLEQARRVAQRLRSG